MTAGNSEGRRRTRRGEETRQRIIEACIECLQEAGYAGTSIETVMSKAGISRGSVLNQFPTRMDLMLATVEAAFRKVVDDIQARFRPVKDPTERLRRMFDLLWENQNIPEAAVITELLLAARWDEALAEALAQVLPAFEVEFDGDIRRTAEAAGARDPEAFVLRARMLILTLRGIMLELMFDADREIILRALDQVRALYQDFCDRMLGEES